MNDQTFNSCPHCGKQFRGVYANCPFCSGTLLAPAPQTYAPQSYAPLPPAPVAASGETEVNFCPKCGTPVTPGDKFCGKCGFDGAGAAPPPPIAAAPPAAAVYVQPVAYAPQSYPQAAPPRVGGGSWNSAAANWGCAGCLGAVVIMCIIGYWLATATIPLNGASSTGATHTVLMKVTGAASTALITYSAGGGTQQQNDVPLPWSTTTQATDGTLLQLIAQNKGSDGDITVTIFNNDDANNPIPLKTATSTGAYVVATTSAFCCTAN